MLNLRTSESSVPPVAELQLAPDVIHPDSDEIETSVHRWVSESGLADRGDALVLARMPRLAARMYPDSPAERVEGYARWIMLLFALDDRSEHDSSRPQDIHDLYERIEAALAGHVPMSDDPLVRAVQEQWRPLTDRMSSAWLHRFTRHLALHGQAMAWEAVLRAERRTPSLATFMDLRLWSNGMFMWDLIETVHPREVPAELTRSLAWRYLTTASNQITAWRNDIVSLPSEMASGNHDNYVLVLAQALGCDRDVAVALVEQQIAQRIDDLPGYEHALRAQARGLSAEQAQAMTDTMTTLRTMVAAHARWVMESVRYSASHHRAA